MNDRYLFRGKRWQINMGKNYLYCPVCDGRFYITNVTKYKYCPNCGSKLDPPSEGGN